MTHDLTFSPHYSPKQNPKSDKDRSDALLSRIEAALDAIKAVAAQDPDHARMANGFGFAKCDVRLGHQLACSTAKAVARNPALASAALMLAGRYRRQVSAGLRSAIGL